MTAVRSPIRIPLRSPLYSPLVGKWGGATRAQEMLANEAAGLAIVFNQQVPELYIKDPTTPANAYYGAPSAKITTTRSTVGWYFDSQGLLQQAATNTPRYTYNPETLIAEGLLSELARVNVVLWNRDLTNAAWVKSSVTALKDQTGMDGIAASASSITATGANGTALQTITLASSARFQTSYVKRLVGSGTLEMTMDNGTTWTVVTPSGSGWQRVSIASQTIANPIVGFRIGTSGDSFAIDLVQNENGAFLSSPMVTTTASFSRGVDTHSIALASLPWDATKGTIYAQGRSEAPNNTARYLFQINDGSNTNKIDGTLSSLGGGQVAITTASAVVANILPGTAYVGLTARLAGTFEANHAQAALDGVLGSQDTSLTPPVLTSLRIGGSFSSGLVNGTIAELVLVPVTKTDAELSAISSVGWPGTAPTINIAPNAAAIEDSDYAATLTATSASVSGVRPISFGSYQYANPGWRRRFRTSAPTLVLHLQNSGLVSGSYNGKGVINVDGVFKQYFTSPNSANTMYVRVDFNTIADREIELVMPYSAALAHLGVSTYGYPITAPTSRAGLPRAVYLGDSRAQGFSGSSIDKHGFEILCRAKGWQNINLGFGSSTIATAWGTVVGDMNPDVVLITSDYNNRTAQTALATFKANLKTTIDNIRALEPTVNIYVVSSNWISAANDALTLTMADYRQQQSDAVSEMTLAGDTNLFYIDGLALTTNSVASQTDGIHPNDAGYVEWAANIAASVTV